jgi:hypothetical protein
LHVYIRLHLVAYRSKDIFVLYSHYPYPLSMLYHLRHVKIVSG